jgi:predicted component of type VI protein secretion system
LYIGRATLKQRRSVAETITLVLEQQNAGFSQVAGALTEGHNVYVKGASPTLYVEQSQPKEDDERREDVQPRRPVSRPPQKRQTQKPLEMRQPRPVPQQQTESPAEEKAPEKPVRTSVSEETVKMYLRKILARNSDLTVKDVRANAAQFGVSADLAEVCFYQVLGEQKQEKVVSNGDVRTNPLQRLAPLDSSVLMKVPTTRISYNGEVDMSDVDGEESPLV